VLRLEVARAAVARVVRAGEREGKLDDDCGRALLDRFALRERAAVLLDLTTKADDQSCAADVDKEDREREEVDEAELDDARTAARDQQLLRPCAESRT